jgi:hypothetical protein
MKKSLLLVSTILSVVTSGASAAADVAASHEPFASGTVVASTKSDLDRIKAHINGYGSKLGLPETVSVVGQSGCSAWCSTTFNSAERFLLNELAGQVLTRFLAIALDDLADGKLDGMINGRKVSYAREVASMLGVEVSEEELKANPVEETLVERLVGLSMEVTVMLIHSGGQKDKIMEHASAFAKRKMDKARKNLAVALIQETDRIIMLELGNGKIDGLDGNNMPINFQKEMKESVDRSIKRVLDGVL